MKAVELSGVDGISKGLLLKYRLSDNVGGVKHFSSVLMVEELPYQPRLARNRFQVRNSGRPMHLFDHNLVNAISKPDLRQAS